MKPLTIDRFGIVRRPNGQRRGNEANGFDIRQLEVVPAEVVEEPKLSRRARQRLQLVQLRNRRSTG